MAEFAFEAGKTNGQYVSFSLKLTFQALVMVRMLPSRFLVVGEGSASIKAGPFFRFRPARSRPEGRIVVLW
jgi:hypothetical protein